ncbi:MAG: hypothetical protein RI542_06215, partial [Wenzhouxiangella sp.]|nr:hypothetical protein [Wenzhouxiangella sp.]
MKVYSVPLVRPVTVHEVAPVVVQVRSSGVDVTSYPVIAEPPSSTGAVQDTVASASPAVAVTPVGALGAPRGVTALLAAEAAPVPSALVAVTVKVYSV